MDSFEAHPTVMWELTRACDQHCLNCTIGATGMPGRNELTTYEAFKTIDQIASLAPREFIITGGDPLKRGDLPPIVEYARRRGLDPAVVITPSARLIDDVLGPLVRSGLTRMIFSLDGSTGASHQSVRGVANTFETTLRSMHSGRSAGLTIELNTLVTRRNEDELAELCDLVRPFTIARWNLYFLVPMTVARQADMLVAGEAERLFRTIYFIQRREDFKIRVIEAPQYRRFRFQREYEEKLQSVEMSNGEGHNDPETVRDDGLQSARNGCGSFVFISHAGDVRSSEFLLFSAGNLRYSPLGTIYRGSDLFAALRDPGNLQGKCGRCEFLPICGGSRARAWAVEGNLFADDPMCTYEPGGKPLLIAH